MTRTNSLLSQAEQRAAGYWFEDGLPALVSGLACLAMAGVLVLIGQAALRHWLILLTLALYGMLQFLLRPLVEWLKQRVTWPRTGYAAPPFFTDADSARVPEPELLSITASQEHLEQRRRRQRSLLLRTCAFAALMLLLLGQLFFKNPWVCGAIGILLGLACLYLARHEQSLAWSVLIGMPFAAIFVLPQHGAAIGGVVSFMTGVGLVLSLGGSVMLNRYLRRNPASRA